MRSKGPFLTLGVLFILFSTNAYACLFSMPPAASMPMESSMPSHPPSSGEAPAPCQTVQCDATAAHNKTEKNCALSTPASTLNALQLVQSDRSVSPLTQPLGPEASLPAHAAQIGSGADSDRPLSAVPLFLLHSTLLL